jgi:MFS transporter, DHA1 family, tetracycline resistance protein
VAVKPLVKRFGEARVLFGGLIAGAIGFAVYGLAPNLWMFALGLPAVALWGTSGPAIQALMSGRVGGGEQGQLQGALASLRGVSGLIGPGLFTLTFAQFVGNWSFAGLPGAPYLLSALLLALGAAYARAIIGQPAAQAA